jgi:hypothetical protein
MSRNGNYFFSTTLLIEPRISLSRCVAAYLRLKRGQGLLSPAMDDLITFFTENLEMKDRSQKTIFIFVVAACLVLTSFIAINHYSHNNKPKGFRENEAISENARKYADGFVPSGMVPVKLTVFNKNIQDKESLSPDCFVNLLVRDAFLFKHVRVIDLSADKADPNKTNVTFSLTIGQEKSLESARQDIAEMTVYIKKNEHGLRNEGLSVQNRPLVFENNGQMFTGIYGTPGR